MEQIFDALFAFLTPEIVLAIVTVGYLMKLSYKFGNFETSFRQLEIKVTEIDARMARFQTESQSSMHSFSNCIVELQSVVTTKFADIVLNQKVKQYFGSAQSPIMLKDQYRPLLKKAKLDKAIERNIDQFVSWLKSQNPQTGFDAQQYIDSFVVNGEIETYIDTTEFKDLLYTKGFTDDAYYGILAL